MPEPFRERHTPEVFMVVSIREGRQRDPQQNGLSNNEMHAMQGRQHDDKAVDPQLRRGRVSRAFVDGPQAVALYCDKC